MRSLEVIENELAAAREALSEAKGTPAEVYSRIVGYYRSVRNWNKGKREEYGERVMFKPDGPLLTSCSPKTAGITDLTASNPAEFCLGKTPHANYVNGENRLLLFVRPACPACPQAKTAAGNLGIPVDYIDADTEEGLAEAAKYQVMSTPTAILLSADGEELSRARDPEGIRAFAGEAVAV